ncbi:MAG: hypothetical protein ACTSYY_09170, partial [Promethearchaeota archaeon]
DYEEYQAGTDPTDPDDFPTTTTTSPTPTDEGGLATGLILGILVITFVAIFVWKTSRRRIKNTG